MKKIGWTMVAILFLGLTASALAAETRIGPRGQVFVDGKPVIPLGVWQQPEYLFDYNRQLGMNCLVCPPGSGGRSHDQDPGYFRAATESDLGSIVHYADRAREEPAVWGWIGPYLSRGRSARAKQRYQEIRGSDPSHFVQVNLPAAYILQGGGGDFYPEALRYTDSVVSHVWPEMLGAQNRDLRNVAVFVDRVREYCRERPGGEVSIWPDINPHQWLKKGEAAPYPAPSPKELRFQIWLALIHGADGICFFPISFDPFVYSQIPAQNEQELIRNARLIGRFTEVLTAEPSPLAITVHGGREGGIVDFTTRRHDGKDYVFALNGIAQPQAVRLEAPGLGKSLRLRDAIGERPLPTADGAYEETLDGLALRIWQLAPAEAHPQVEDTRP